MVHGECSIPLTGKSGPPDNKLLTLSHPHLYACEYGAICSGYRKGSRTKVTAENRLSLERQKVFWQLLYTPELLF